MNDLIYDVNVKTRTVVCKVQHCRQDFLRITEKILSRYSPRIQQFYRNIAVYYAADIHDEYEGVAVCSLLDDFNVQYGKDLARTRAIVKREETFERVLDKIFDDITILLDVNIDIDRDYVLDKHLCNLDALLDEGISLAQMRGYDKDECEDNIDLNKDYTPHCCSLCDKKFVNYKDDKDYLANEHNWWPIDLPNGQNLEVCSSCMDTLKKLSK